MYGIIDNGKNTNQSRSCNDWDEMKTELLDGVVVIIQIEYMINTIEIPIKIIPLNTELLSTPECDLLKRSSSSRFWFVNIIYQ